MRRIRMRVAAAVPQALHQAQAVAHLAVPPWKEAARLCAAVRMLAAPGALNLTERRAA
ncbi:hypothetical protein AFIC_002248 [[Pseudomonas] carboxydohydrogena]|uniref:Uncharacterized protein n=1 Tax=Afipia carboxydohydrogena TaxID=290 RepID=A0ABY8BP44_AFICR|nr:hypothetical protein [[Pseudomonas] carboxydohydrogena]WEF50699.1 hypothetical protein AFIC_002248 [[Pseudomonas] carboxydohydrogena]